MSNLDPNLKQAFSKVKDDINQLKNQIKQLDDELNSQKTSLNEILPKINEIYSILKYLKKEVSTGNEGVRQTDRHLDRQTDTRQTDASKPLNIGLNINNSDFTDDKVLDKQTDTRQTLRQTDTSQEHQQTQNNLKIIADDINKMFLKLSKQELRIFLTIYQLEDEGIEPTHRSISIKTQLSESCIRDHVSSLFRKNTPILKKRLNNHTNVFSVLKDFRALNLKNRLINLYYDSDPHQKTLLDI